MKQPTKRVVQRTELFKRIMSDTERENGRINQRTVADTRRSRLREEQDQELGISTCQPSTSGASSSPSSSNGTGPSTSRASASQLATLQPSSSSPSTSRFPAALPSPTRASTSQSFASPSNSYSSHSTYSYASSRQSSSSESPASQPSSSSSSSSRQTGGPDRAWTPPPVETVVNDIEEETLGYWEVVAVAKVTEDRIIVVGTSFPTNSPGVCQKPEDLECDVGQFLIVNCYSGEQERRNPYHTWTNRQDFVQIREIRNLTEEERQWIKERLRNKERINLEEAKRFIRDPHVSATELETYLEHSSAAGAVLELPLQHHSRVNGRCVLLILRLTEEEYCRCFKTNFDKWDSSNLAVQHPFLRIGSRMEPIFVNVGELRKLRESTDYLVTLVAENDMLLRMFNNPDRRHWHHLWRVGPCCRHSSVAKSIKYGFDEFYWRREMFEKFCGRTESVEMAENENEIDGASLDPHQLFFIKAASSHPGWTCAQGPPGCGKSHAVTALISYLKMSGVKEGLCVTGTTNAAVTNAADKVEEDAPTVKITGNYSYNAQEICHKISQKTEASSVRRMAQDYAPHVGESQEMFEKRRNNRRAKVAYSSTTFQNPLHESYAKLDEVRTANVLHRGFISRCEMDVYVTTTELLIRGGDSYLNGIDRKKSIKRLIIEEAGQLSSSEALAVYCRLPHLTHVTLIGDSQFLMSRSYIGQETEVYQFIAEGELKRMYNLPSTIKKDFKIHYRCHPLMRRTILTSIYGEIESGITTKDRNLAEFKGLPVANDGTPVNFYHVRGQEQQCCNLQEAENVADFIVDLILYKIHEEDLVLLVFHRRQKDLLQKKLEERMLYKGRLVKRPIRVETVGDFQGKEAKIIILSTAKAAIGEERSIKKLKFIGEAPRATIALSRAQEAVYVFGDLLMLAREKFYAAIMEDLLKIGAIKGQSIGRELRPEEMTQLRANLAKSLKEIRKERKAAKEAKKHEKDEKKKKLLEAKKTPVADDTAAPDVNGNGEGLVQDENLPPGGVMEDVLDIEKDSK